MTQTDKCKSNQREYDAKTERLTGAVMVRRKALHAAEEKLSDHLCGPRERVRVVT